MTRPVPVAHRISGALSSVIVGAALVLYVAAASAPVAADDHKPVIDVPKSDPEMNAAIAKARASLPTFWASYDAPKPNETNHAVKVHFPTGGGGTGEHIWVADVKRRPGGTFTGRFANQPLHLPGRNEGDPVEFKEAEITDWMFMRNGRIVGGETIRPLLKLMSKAEADALRARMEQP